MSKKTKRAFERQHALPRIDSMRRTLPPDPEQGNDARAAAANYAVEAFRSATGCDKQDALGDLLASLMHLCDRDAALGSFYPQLHRAERHYFEETADNKAYAQLR